MFKSPKQLVILSGKGGTGKTSVAAAFAHLAHKGLVGKNGERRAVLADVDVDAANLELVLRPKKLEKHEFAGGAVAEIQQEICGGCGICKDVCRFEAILIVPAAGGNQYRVDPIACDGCAACVYQCPEEAIVMQRQIAGHWFHSKSRYGPLFHAALRPAQENSGKLVTMVKQNARLLALDESYDLVLLDGPPGIGCPVISAASGADLALIVAEPTVSGVHDMRRALETCHHFGLRALVCINKADLYPQGADEIAAFCREEQVELVGLIAFDENITAAMLQGEPVTAYAPDSPASQDLQSLWIAVAEALEEGET